MMIVAVVHCKIIEEIFVKFFLMFWANCHWTNQKENLSGFSFNISLHRHFPRDFLLSFPFKILKKGLNQFWCYKKCNPWQDFCNIVLSRKEEENVFWIVHRSLFAKCCKKNVAVHLVKILTKKSITLRIIHH